MKYFSRYRSGFTLIELLVVIAIIGVLSSVVLGSLNTARAKSRDARRMRDMKEIQTALNLYYQDNGSFPLPVGGTWNGYLTTGCGVAGSLSGAGGYIPSLAPTYIKELPRDPGGITGGCSGYLYISNGVDYKLLDHSTGPESFPSSSSGFYDPIRPGWSWAICSSPTACATW